MTAEELKSKIAFTTRQGLYGDTIITGSLLLSHEVYIGRHEHDPDERARDAQALIREEIARAVYGWQQEEFYEALHEYMVLHHAMGDYIAANAAHERLLKAARYQESSPKKEGR